MDANSQSKASTWLREGKMALTKSTDRMTNGAALNVKDFGAVGDGVTNDTAAIQAAINEATFYYPNPTTVAQTGVEIYFPRGIYLVDGLTIVNTGNNGYINGIALTGQWAVLKGTPSCTRIVSIDAAGPSAGEFTNGIRINGLQFDLTAMTTTGAFPYTPGSVGLRIRNSAHGRYENLTFFGGPTNNVHIHLVDNGSMNTFLNIDCSRIQIDGEDFVADFVHTTTNFYSVTCTGFKIAAAWGLGFYGCVVQNPGLNYGAAFDLTDCRHLTIIGGDFEGTSGKVFNIQGSSVSNIIASNNSVSTLPIYISGTARNSDFQDKEEWVRSVVNGNKAVIVTTSPTEIYDFRGDPADGSGNTLTAAKLMVWGKAATFSFYDEVLLFQSALTTLSSTTISGSPPARTYVLSGDRIQCSVATGDAAVQTTGIAMPDSAGF